MTQSERQKANSFLFKLNVTMLLLSTFVVIVGLFETSAAFYSLTGSHDVVFPLHSSDSTLLNGIKFFPLKFGVASTNDSAPGSAYPNVYVCWEDSEGDFVEAFQKVFQEGMHCYIFDLV